MGTRATMRRAETPCQPPSRYAKLTPPHLHDALVRTRLFELLDNARARHQAIWIASPPGAGKTVLAATWLAHCGAPAIWCDLDQADADPATLFFFLAEAARGLAAEMVWDAPAAGTEPLRLARQFFRSFYAALPAGAVLVLDNAHDVDWANAGYLLESALNEMPDGVTVLLAGREAPPLRLARLELNARLCVIGWDALRLDRGEARALAQVGDTDDAAALQWLDLADGWAAGVVMLRSGARAAPPAALLASGREAVYRYFAGEILGLMPASCQRTLMLLSCLPALSCADAEALTGEAGCARLLADLYQHRMFVERRAGQDDTYQLHRLFAEFLRQQAQLRLAPGVLAALAERAAALLEDQGRLDEAAMLYQEAQAPQALAGFIVRRAPAMMASGRGETWRLWMSGLDDEQIAPRPELLYWHGVSLCEIRPLHARSILMRAERAFAQSGQEGARLLAIAAIIDSYDAEWADASALTHWIAELTQGLAHTDLMTLDPGVDLRLHSRLAAALLSMAPDSALLAPSAERALRAMQAVDEPAELLAAGAILLRYFEWLDSAARANALVTQLSRLADADAASPSHLVRWYARVARWYNRDGQVQQSQQAVSAARRICGGNELDPQLFQLLEAHHLLEAGQLAPARLLLDRIGTTLAPASSPDLVEWRSLDARWHALSGDLDGALQAAHDTVRLGAEASLPAWEQARFDAFLGACLAWAGDLAQAACCYERAAAAAYGVQAVLLREERGFIAAYAALLAAPTPGAVALLRAALDGHRRRRCSALFPMLPQLAARLAALALEHQIEAEHVAAIVMRQQLVAPYRSLPCWPWAVAVRTLGKFEITLHGVAAASSGKAQQRPLALLKILVAAGEGGKAQQALVGQLWGNADVAKSALNVTLHRLRKLLKTDTAIIVSGGRMQLDEASVWSDIGALAELCAAIPSAPGALASSDVQGLAASLLELYRGPFCDGADEGWILPVRDRARNLFLGAVARLGQQLETAADWSGALSLYQRALNAEPLSEANYRGWMRCAHAIDGAAAAFGAYRRCRDTLSIVLGVAPALETERLAVSLGLK